MEKRKIIAKAKRSTNGKQFLKDDDYKPEKKVGSNYMKVGDYLNGSDEYKKPYEGLYKGSFDKERLWWYTEETDPVKKRKKKKPQDEGGAEAHDDVEEGLEVAAVANA